MPGSPAYAFDDECPDIEPDLSATSPPLPAPVALMSDDLRVSSDLVIPASELDERFSTSGGPGGQHANKASTRVDLSLDVAASSSLTDDQRALLLENLATRLASGVLTVSVDDSRSQWRNRAIARRRLAEILANGLVKPVDRRPTRRTTASKRRRLDAKRRRSELKRQRRRPDVQ